MTSITHTSFYNVTCKVCVVIRNAIIAFFVAAIALGESAGRARAARELANMGRYEEAKALMLRKDKEDV
jgi:hypothetical protein